MKTHNRILVILALVISLSVSPVSASTNAIYEVPNLVSFTPSRTSVELNSTNTKISFTLVLSHPVGIKSNSTTMWLKSRDGRILISTQLTKLINATLTKEYKFTGEFILDSNLPPGLYDFYADPVEGESSIRGRGPTTPTLYPLPFNNFQDGESSILLRANGKLNLSTPTFVGPSHSSIVKVSDDKPASFEQLVPIFRVGELYDPTNYFVTRVQGIKLKVESLSQQNCVAENNQLRFIAIGMCTYRVYTESNNDYLSTTITLSSMIESARIKPTITPPTIKNQDVKNLPKRIETFLTYNSVGLIVSPVSITPEVCNVNFQYINIVGGGKCILTYQTIATTNYLASDVYQSIFEVVKDSQTISFFPQPSESLTKENIELVATASSGGLVTFQSQTLDICRVEVTKLRLLKAGECKISAIQAGSSMISQVSTNATIQVIGNSIQKTRSIICVKGKSSRKVTGEKPKCPKGFSLNKR